MAKGLKVKDTNRILELEHRHPAEISDAEKAELAVLQERLEAEGLWKE